MVRHQQWKVDLDRTYLLLSSPLSCLLAGRLAYVVVCFFIPVGAGVLDWRSSPTILRACRRTVWTWSTRHSYLSEACARPAEASRSCHSAGDRGLLVVWTVYFISYRILFSASLFLRPCLRQLFFSGILWNLGGIFFWSYVKDQWSSILAVPLRRPRLRSSPDWHPFV